MTPDPQVPRRRPYGRLLIGLAVLAGVLVLAGANAHLVYVAATSQPDCVTHAKLPSADGPYRAAKSSC